MSLTDRLKNLTYVKPEISNPEKEECGDQMLGREGERQGNAGKKGQFSSA